MSLSPYAKVFYEKNDKYIYYRSDLHTYIELHWDLKTHENFRQYLEKGVEKSELKDFFLSLGFQNIDILISKLISAGIIE